jgi:hypothetical protein
MLPVALVGFVAGFYIPDMSSDGITRHPPNFAVASS